MKIDRKHTAIFFDADGTLLEEENPYLFMARILHCESEVRTWVKMYLKKQLSYRKLIDQEIKLFLRQYHKLYGKFPIKGDLEKLLPQSKIRKGAKQIFSKLFSTQRKTFVLSSGFYTIIKRLTHFNINPNNLFANDFTYDQHDKLTGIKINVYASKVGKLKQIMRQHNLLPSQIAYVGDNAFDQPLFKFVTRNGGISILLDRGNKSQFQLPAAFDTAKLIKISNLQTLNHLISA